MSFPSLPFSHERRERKFITSKLYIVEMSGEILKIMWDNLDLLYIRFTGRREYGGVSYACNETTKVMMIMMMSMIMAILMMMVMMTIRWWWRSKRRRRIIMYVVILQAAEALIVPLCWEVHSVLALFFTSHYKILCDNQNQFSFSVCCKISLC